MNQSKQEINVGIMPEDQNAVTELAASLKPLVQKLTKNLAKLQKSSQDLNLKGYVEAYSSFDGDLQTTVELWNSHEESDCDLVAQANNWLISQEYSQLLETCLCDLKVPFTGSFPEYEIPPFKLSIQVERRIVKLSMGKKSQQTNIFAPKPLADWVSEKYQTLMNSSFNSDQLCKELLEAYPYLSNKSWGVTVSLKDIYQLLTLRSNTKKEYPEPIFMFDLGRLLESVKIEYKGHSFDFQPHKISNKNYAIIDRRGKERQLGLISIYKVD